MTEQHTVVNGNSTLTLKFTATVKENIFPNRDILSTIRVKREKEILTIPKKKSP